MKYQHLAVIFCLIIVPISMVVGLFTSSMIKVSEKESAYTSLLYNSTYDAVRAYQINTQNNNYSSEKTSRIRDLILFLVVWRLDFLQVVTLKLN